MYAPIRSANIVLAEVLRPLAAHPPAVVSRDRSQVPHERVLTLTLEDACEIRIRLDQGLGYWRARKSVAWHRAAALDDAFAYRADPQVQAQKLAALRAHVTGNDYKTVLLVTAAAAADG